MKKWFCFFFGHVRPRDLADWEKELAMKGEPFTWICSRCDVVYHESKNGTHRITQCCGCAIPLVPHHETPCNCKCHPIK